jgi:hypothetical protein
VSNYDPIRFADALPEDTLPDDPLANAPPGDQRVIKSLWEVKKHSIRSPVERARAMYRNRRARILHFDASLFAEPCWDILLDLFIANGEEKSISVSSACIGAAAPHATALRHLGLMQRKGLVERSAHPNDRRCQQVNITRAAAASMHDLFASLPDCDLPQQLWLA